MAQSTSSIGQGGMVTGLFRDKDNAERAYRAAVALGHQDADINVLMSDDTRNRYFESGRDTQTDLASKATKHAEEELKSAKQLGGPVGGTAGTVAPVLAALGTLLLVPGLGLVAAGPIAIALSAAGAVGLAGGLVGALTNWGVPKGRVEQYAQGIRDGGILLAVKPTSEKDCSALMREWQANGGEFVHA